MNEIDKPLELVTMGKWKGVKWRDVPKKYLEILIDKQYGLTETSYAPSYKKFLDDAYTELLRRKAL